jgi:hypothetical protein
MDNDAAADATRRAAVREQKLGATSEEAPLLSGSGVLRASHTDASDATGLTTSSELRPWPLRDGALPACGGLVGHGWGFTGDDGDVTVVVSSAAAASTAAPAVRRPVAHCLTVAVDFAAFLL